MARLNRLPPRIQSIGPRVQAMQAGSWRTDKQSSTARGYGYEWQKLRARHIAEHPFCVMCLDQLGIVAKDAAGIIVECATRGIAAPHGNVADHKLPHRGRRELQLDPDNIQTLCTAHHSGDKQRMENGSP